MHKYLILSSLILAGCTAMGGAISSALTPSKGIDATAQIGEDNNKGAIALQSSNKVEVAEVQGNSQVVTNSSSGMASMALIGLIPFMLLTVYLLPAPKWVHKLIDRRNKNEQVQR